MCRENVSIYGAHIPRNALNLCSFTHAPVLHSILQVDYILKTCFPQDRKGGGRYDLLCQNSVRKYEDDL